MEILGIVFMCLFVVSEFLGVFPKIKQNSVYPIVVTIFSALNNFFVGKFPALKENKVYSIIAAVLGSIKGLVIVEEEK